MAALLLPAITALEMDIPTLMDSTVTQLIAKLEGNYSEISTRLIPCILHERQSAQKLIKKIRR
jgi:DNA-binding LacI/PurR family transcriptional regulator